MARPRSWSRKAFRKAAPIRWPLVALSGGIIILARKRREIGLPPLASTALVALGPVVTAIALPPGRLRYATVWAHQMWAYKIAFEVPHDRRERLRERMQIDYPIQVDGLIGLGKPPGQRLQAALRHPPAITALDRLMAGIYALWELEPHAVLAFILWRHPRRFLPAAARLAATFDLTLVGYWAVPTAPPWWASERADRMDRSVRRVVIEVKRDLRGEPRPVADHEVGANPWAAMPSDHFASALAAGLLLYEVDERLGVAALAYAFALGFALVYLGEHYVTDLVAGGALALGVRATARRLAP